MLKITNTLVKPYLRYKYNKLSYSTMHSSLSQNSQFDFLMSGLCNTAIGNQYSIVEDTSLDVFQARMPLHHYDDIKPYIQRMLNGEEHVLWPGKITMFSKSSGTTSDTSKYIPVSTENLYGNHIKGAWDTLGILYNNHPDLRIFAGKNLLIPGYIERYENNPEVMIGDISALMTYHMPMIGRPFFVPGIETALMKDFEEKINLMATLLADEDIVMFGGVPTWNVVLFRKILSYTGKKNLLEIWPDLQVYIHGGVGFEPYREQFKRFIPKEDFIYQEVYNASEGYFATQDQKDSKGLLLLLNNGVFYEFIPLGEIHKDNPRVLTLEEVKEGPTYALVISTNSGLWRYIIGDLVRFVSIDPFRIVIEGRTAQFINVFGEEVMVSNTDKAISIASQKTGARVSDYTVAPIYFEPGQPGGHEWLIEFDVPPNDETKFAVILDQSLRDINSDYNAKRYKDMALRQLTLHSIPKGTFVRWLKKRGKLGAQSKVPRLSNDRKLFSQLLQFIADE